MTLWLHRGLERSDVHNQLMSITDVHKKVEQIIFDTCRHFTWRQTQILSNEFLWLYMTLLLDSAYYMFDSRHYRYCTMVHQLPLHEYKPLCLNPSVLHGYDLHVPYDVDWSYYLLFLKHAENSVWDIWAGFNILSSTKSPASSSVPTHSACPDGRDSCYGLRRWRPMAKRGKPRQKFLHWFSFYLHSATRTAPFHCEGKRALESVATSIIFTIDDWRLTIDLFLVFFTDNLLPETCHPRVHVRSVRDPGQGIWRQCHPIPQGGL